MKSLRTIRLAVLALAMGSLPTLASAQQRAGAAGDEWPYIFADSWSTRFSPLTQIDASNFEDLEVAWLWRGDNYGPEVDYVMRSTPIYQDGLLYTVAGTRRTVIAIDPATGETIWTYREPHTTRWERSPRQNYGKGVAYEMVDGRGVIFYASPAFFLHALDAKTGRPIEGFGDDGTVDMLADLGHPYDPDYGIPDSIGNITNSSPPIIVDGVVIVGNSAAQGLSYTRIENVPGDILAYDMRTGEHLWKFNAIPQPGEFGHETWESDAWQYAGNVNAWAPMSADLERGIVYIPTDAPTNDAFGGFRPGDNLFGSSLLALRASTGERVWHFQTVHHDIWDYDNPVAPILMDITVDGERIPAVIQNTKQGFTFTFNRVTGEPVWPIVETPVPQSTIPEEHTSPTQPIPSKPAPYERQGFSEDDLIDFTPEVRRLALELTENVQFGPVYLPGIPADNPTGKTMSVVCPSVTGGLNIMGGPAADPTTGILYTASVSSCSALSMVRGSERDDGGTGTGDQTGVTVSDWVSGGGGMRGPEGLPIQKPPYGRITAIDMNTGEHLWWIPNGETPDRIRNHALLEGVDIGNTGQPSHAHVIVTGSLMIYGEGRTGEPRLHAVNKRTGEELGTVEIPGSTSAPMMTFEHEGSQYIVIPVAGNGMPGSFAALRLPD